MNHTCVWRAFPSERTASADLKVGWVGLFQNWQRGWCGWRRASEGHIIGDAASTGEGL